MDKLKFVAPCLLGVEGLVANELKFMGAENVSAQNGRVIFEGDYSILARANINSRYAERILILLSEFVVHNFEDLFSGVKKIKWYKYISKTDAFPVKGRCLNSQLSSVPSCQKIIKKAIVENLKEKYMLSWFEETGPVHQIQFLIMKDKVSIMLDTSGSGLHKRGYRKVSNEAPIKETLAAAMVEISKVRSNHLIVDPMCGSGTILIESALKALNIAPGINRYFAAESWNQVPSEFWEQERKLAKEKENLNCDFKAIGYDIDEDVLNIAQENALKANVADRITFINRDIKDFNPEFEKCTVITNPPYGERLLNVEQAEQLYKIMGEKFLPRYGYSYTIISPDDDFEKCFGRQADKRRKLYNGMLKCQVYMYFR